jgi:hypothetical protein
MKISGLLSKMSTKSDDIVRYTLPFQEVHFDLNSLVGKRIKLTHSGKVYCGNCSKQIKKSYAQGYCYPCTMKLAACDLCILKPELCHFDKGTCREPSWGEEHCLKPHYIYLANSSGLKVGITRKVNVPHRWIDQGATEALPIIEVNDRLTSGQIEVLFKKHIADKTDWRKMLKGVPEGIDLKAWKEKLLKELEVELANHKFKILNEDVQRFDYPILRYPDKISSISLDKITEINDLVIGIKGQYLIFDHGVLNVRSHTGYEVTLEEIHATA